MKQRKGAEKEKAEGTRANFDSRSAGIEATAYSASALWANHVSHDMKMQQHLLQLSFGQYIFSYCLLLTRHATCAG